MGYWARFLKFIGVDATQTEQTTALNDAAHACSGCRKQPSLAKLSPTEFVVLCLNKECEAPLIAETQSSEQAAVDAWNALFLSAETQQRAAFTLTGARHRFKKQ